MRPSRPRKRKPSPLRRPPRRTRPAPNPSRRPPAPPSAAAGAGRPERLQKLLAAAGVGSRRQIEDWIAAGRVAVGGRPARLGDKATTADRITVDGSPVALAGREGTAPRVIAYHKPEGELVTRDDPQGRDTVFRHLPPLRGGRWIAVGRLDLNTSGLLLLTDSGELAERLMHPRHAFSREYAARVRGELAPDQRRRLLAGVRLPDGPASFERLEAMEGASPEAANRWYRVSLREGRNREVRRLFEAVGLQVSRLIRVRFGPVSLPRDLRRGRWRELSPAEIRALLG